MEAYNISQEKKEKYRIKNLPEIRLYIKDEEFEVYEGIKKNELIREWVLKKMEPLVKIIDSLDELETFVNSHDLIILVNGRDNQEFIERISRRLNDVFFLITENQEIIKKYNEKVTFFRKFDQKNPISKPSLKGLLTFIEKYRFPLPMRLLYKSMEWILYRKDSVLCERLKWLLRLSILMMRISPKRKSRILLRKSIWE